MNVIEFEDVIRHITKNHSFCRITNYKSTYQGRYKGKDVIVILTDNGMNRYIYMNGMQYFTCMNGNYQKGVRMI